MKITKQRLKEIIKEELENSVFWSQMRLDDKKAPFLVLVPSAPVEERYVGKTGDQLVSLEKARAFKTLKAAEGVQTRLGRNAEVQPDDRIKKPEEDSDDPGLELSAPTIPQLKKLGYNPYK